MKAFITKCKRVLKSTKKPNRFEFMTVAKVAGIGILLIGLFGFLFYLVRELLF